MRGPEDATERATARLERVGVPAKVNALVAQGQFGRILAALGAGRPVEAYEAAERLFDPLDPAHHPLLACWVIGDLAEAAVQADLVTQGRARLAQIESAVGPTPGAWIALNLRHARAVLADDDEAAECFAAALEADLSRWPYQRARLLLAQGRWLRRRRAITDSRGPLRAARDAFDALGCAAWADQARRELRASGERSRRPRPEARDQLTAQELQIAQLAARGLSNRDIGQRLYLSHRTVSTHLYRAFPKLGITSRGELGDALTGDSRVGGTNR
jgi:DNA-binding CsgD family transcriptional regulator